MWHFFSRSKVHGRVQSPVEFRYHLLHTALWRCPPSLHHFIIRSLVSKLSCSPSLVSKLSCFLSLVSKLSCSPSLVSKFSSYPTAPRRTVITRIRSVSGMLPAICCCCCLDLWEVIQLLKHLSSLVWAHDVESLAMVPSNLHLPHEILVIDELLSTNPIWRSSSTFALISLWIFGFLG